ncbi:MAG: biotin--[acetyl-CoA-carboxylase] ligase [Saprospiraceae bacterium]
MSNTLFIGKVLHRFEELPSTNDWAAETLSKTKPPEGTVVRADNQTDGRGQLGSHWHSAAGENLLLSIILYPTWLEAQAQFYLSMAVALALRDTIGIRNAECGMRNHARQIPHSPFRIPHSIKWPNDLYLHDKKTAGILIQNTLVGSCLQSAIIGIGLNVNQTTFPPDLPHATSLALAFGQKLDLDEVAERLFECLEQRYLQLKAGHRSAIKAEYEQHLWRRGQPSRFVRSSDGSELSGIILGVTEQGLLRVEMERGVEDFELKQLKFVL